MGRNRKPLSNKALLDVVTRLDKLELKGVKKRKTAEVKNIYATKGKVGLLWKEDS